MSRSTFHSSSMYTTRIATQMYGQSTTTYLRVGGRGWVGEGGVGGRAADRSRGWAGGGSGGGAAAGRGGPPAHVLTTM